MSRNWGSCRDLLPRRIGGIPTGHPRASPDLDGGREDALGFAICYDITDDRRRARVSTALLDYGARLQESVFVATLDDELLTRQGPFVSAVRDVCGEGVVPEDQEYYIV